MKLRLSTSNIINGGTSIVRRPASEKSNVELVNGLRSNFTASMQASMPPGNGDILDAADGNGAIKNAALPYTSWTNVDNGHLNVPANNPDDHGLAEERSEYDITVKFFLLPKTRFSDWRRHLQDAISAVLQELSVGSVDLLIISFPGVSFDADSEETGGCGSNKIQASETELVDAILDVWNMVATLQVNGVALKTGVAEFGCERLKEFLSKTSHRPMVNQINVRDACEVPQSIMELAKQERIELLTHNDCANILPQGTLRDLLGDGPNGAGLLAGPNAQTKGLEGDLSPEWVVKYTAVVRDRGVIEHKGYFAVAIAFMAAFEQQKVSYTISLATALHKMPATLGLVTHLVGVGWQKFYVIGGLLAFAMASPAAILLTYKLLEQAPNLLGAVSVSLFVTFSGGVFLYVALANLVGINSLKSTLGARQQLLLLFCGLSLPILFEFMLGRLS